MPAVERKPLNPSPPKPMPATPVAPSTIRPAATAPIRPPVTVPKPQEKKRGLFGTKDKAKDKEPPVSAWIMGQPEKATYDLNYLFSGSVVPELWDDIYGDTLVYLFPKSAGKNASFKLPSSTIASSNMLWKIAIEGTTQGSNPRLSSTHLTQAGLAAGPASPQLQYQNAVPKELHLYLPLPLEPQATASTGKINLSQKDRDTLLGARNLFAFLVGQPLVATMNRPTIFSIFIQISTLLTHYGFSSPDQTTFGEAAATNFDLYIDELHLADVRQSQEKTVDMLVLSERLRSAPLYIESFVHAVGKYNDLQRTAAASGPNGRFSLISAVTRTRLERAAIDLGNRQKSVDLKLVDFDFPGLWTGIMNSKSADEGAPSELYLMERRLPQDAKARHQLFKHEMGQVAPTCK